jgi:hypothetical protein
MMQRYDGQGSPLKHLEKCITLWMIKPPEEWTHYFLHALEGILANWYVDQKLRRGTTEWTMIQKNIKITFSFEHENPNID